MAIPPYLVHITGSGPRGVKVTGTGFFVNQAGSVLTCRHVVFTGAEPCTAILVQELHGAPMKYRLRSASGEEDDLDLAILEPEVPINGEVSPAKIHPDWQKYTRVNDPITAWGYSAAKHVDAGQPFNGNIAAFAGRYGLISINCLLNSGDSGGPVLDSSGRVIGISRVKDAENVGHAMAIPVSKAIDFLRLNAVPFIEDSPAEHPLHEFPPGPRVPRYLIPLSVEQEIAEAVPTDAAMGMVNAANLMRQQADSGDPTATLISVSTLPDPMRGSIQFWRTTFTEACLHGPRMVAALLLVIGDTHWNPGPKELRKQLLKTLKNL